MVVLGPKDMEHATAEDEVVFAPGALGQRSSDAGRARTRAARKGFAAAALVHAHLDSLVADVGKLDIGLLGEYGVKSLMKVIAWGLPIETQVKANGPQGELISISRA